MKQNVTTQREEMNMADVTAEGDEMQKASPLVQCAQFGQAKVEDNESIDMIPLPEFRDRRSRSQLYSGTANFALNFLKPLN